jgi:hypothetical protein
MPVVHSQGPVLFGARPPNLIGRMRFAAFQFVAVLQGPAQGQSLSVSVRLQAWENFEPRNLWGIVLPKKQG